MSYRLTHEQFNSWLANLRATAAVYAPAVMPRCGRHSDQEVIGYRPVASLAEFVLDRKSYHSPKEVVFPIRETLFRFVDGTPVEPAESAISPAIVFLRACDLNGIERLDTIFLRNGPEPDPYYARRRAQVTFVLIECTTGFDSCFCVSMNANRAAGHAAAVRFGGPDAGVLLELDAAQPLAATLPPGLEAAEFTPGFVSRNTLQVQLPSPSQLTPESFNDPLWKEYTRRCIACGRCNTSCVTCSCFNMQDVALDAATHTSERRRVWTGCHLEDFTTMAGGHEFRKDYGDRMRFKTLHKISDYHRRFGKHMCVGCGRCDDVCPEYISFSRCVNRLATTAFPGGKSG